MKGKVSKLRPSPNEEARLIREEHERRRKLRIQQVREQQRYIALKIRQEVERRRQLELEQLGEELRLDWERQQKEKVDTLQRLYQESLQLLGQGHRSAKENEPDLAAVAQKEEENHTKAEERYREALKELKSQRLKDHETQTRAINARKMALQTEKERAARVASLPPPSPLSDIDSKKPHVVKKSFASAFSHMPESTVYIEGHTQQPNAHEGAELEARRLQHLQKDEKKKREEQLEKARLRGKEALRREQLMQDRERLLVELEHMQQTDLLRRRQQVSQMPPQIFQPLYKRHEMREDLQREMEFAFEDMYTGERRIKGDLVVQLMPEPLPALSTSSQDQELDVTVDEDVTPDTENTQADAEEEDERTETRVHVAKPKPAPRRALKKLLDRIRSQRSYSGGVPAAASGTVLPLQDTSITTGSLSSEEDKRPPLGLLHPSHSPPALETTEPSTQSQTADPGTPAHTMEEDEPRKREEDVEEEKRQQLILLQELEEQKSRLEQLLLEAQQEREQLKAEVPQHPVAPEGSSVSTEPRPPAGEDEHTRRIRQYQQELLERRRVHQRSVETARQHLEEYQRALRVRHVSSTLLPPAVTPPGLFHQAPVPTTSAASANIPGKMQTAVKFPTRDSATQASTLPPTGSSLADGSKLLPDEMNTLSNSLRNQRADVTAWLTDGIMDKVTDTMRPSSSNKPFTSHRSVNIPVKPWSAVGGSVCPSIAERPPLLQGHGDTRPASLLHNVSPIDDDVDTQRQELQVSSLRSGEEDLACQSRDLQQEEQEASQALVDSHTQPVPEVLQNIKQTRLRLLGSLLKAIEESNGGTLPHLRPSPGPRDPTVQTQPSGLHPSHRATKPPVTRVRLGTVKVMPEQHELSVIQEVETPVDGSLITGPEVSVVVSPIPDSGGVWDSGGIWDAQEESLQPCPVSSCGQQMDQSPAGSASRRLLTGAGTSEVSKPGSVPRIISPLSSDSGRGADFSGPAVISSSSLTESPRRSADFDGLSSTTISTGSYITTDPEQNTGDKASLDICSPSPQSFCKNEGSAAGRPGLALFHDSSIQRIIERYTRELDVSLSSAGTTGVGDPSHVDTLRSWVQTPERRAATTAHGSPPSATQRSSQECIHGEDPDLVQPADESAVVPLVGHPSAHSSVIGLLPTSLDQGGWDSTLSRMIGPRSRRSAGDFDAGPMGLEQLTAWPDEGQEQSLMRPLLGEQDSGSQSSPPLPREADLGPETTEAFPGLDSFHPLLAELTHNETADASTSFHLPEHVLNSPARRLASGRTETCPDQTEPSPERLRTQEQHMCSTASRESMLAVCPAVDLTPETLSHLSMCEASCVSAAQLEETHGDSAVTSDLCAEEQECDVSKASDVASDRGILEQSEITLVSLTDTTVQDQETDEDCEETQEAPETKGSEFTLLQEEMPWSKNHARPVTFLEFHWGPNRDLQDVYQRKRTVLLQRSSRRLDQVKAKRLSAPVTCKGPRLEDPKPNPGASEQRHPEKPGSAEQMTVLQPPPGSERRLQQLDVTHRKREVSKMHQRTQRLYAQLEEVKHQRAIRSRQEAYAANRAKAKEFHKKTLQKLRAKQTPQ